MIDQRQMAREIRFIEIRMPFAPVVFWKTGNPIAVHCPGQQTGRHRRVNDHPDPFALGSAEESRSRLRDAAVSTAAAAMGQAQSQTITGYPLYRLYRRSKPASAHHAGKKLFVCLS